MKKVCSLVAVIAILLVAVMAALPTSAEAATITKVPATDWAPVTENSTICSVTATDAGTKLSFASSTWGGDYLIGTKNAYKLDGLYLWITDINLLANGAGNYCINLCLSSAQNQLASDAQSKNLLFLMNNFGSDLYAAGASVPGGGVAPQRGVANHGISLLFTRNADDSYTVCATGTDTRTFTIPAATIADCFGSADPSVYLTVSDNWWGNGAHADNNFTIRELSTGNTNRFTNYYDPWSRDIYVTQEGPLSNITIKHNGNHGAYANLAEKMPLAGLTLKDVAIDWMASFRFSYNRAVMSDNGYVGNEEGKAGFLIRLDVNGDVYSTYAEGGVTPEDKIGNLGEGFTKFTMQILPQVDGSMVLYIDADNGNTVAVPLAKEDLEWAFGNLENLEVNLGYSARDNGDNPIKTTTIGSIYNVDVADYAAAAPADLAAAKTETAFTATCTEPTNGVVTYQWYKNTTNSTEGGTAIEGATEASLAIPTDLEAGTYYYYCVATVETRTGDTDAAASNVIEYVVAADDDNNDNDDNNNDDNTGNDDEGKNPDTGVSVGVAALALLTLSGSAAVVLRKKN